MRGKTTHVVFSDSRIAETPVLYQYDYGQQLVFDNITLPAQYEVIFSNGAIEDGKAVIATTNTVTIPDEYLLNGKNIMCWVFLHETETDGETEYVVRIPVRPRSRRSDEEPTPVQLSEIEQTMAALSAGVSHVDAVSAEIDSKLITAEQLQELLKRVQDLENVGMRIGTGITLRNKSVEDDVVRFSEFSVHIDDYIAVVFCVSLPSGKTAADYPNAYMTLSDVDDKFDPETTYPLSEAFVRDDGKYEFSVPIMSLAFADMITPTLHYTEGNEAKTVAGKPSSIEEYVGWAINNVTYQNLQVVKDFMDYGYYAYLYLDSKNQANCTPVTLHFTDEYDYDHYIAMVEDDAPIKQLGVDVRNLATSGQFGSQITLRFGMQVPAGFDIQTATLDGIEIEIPANRVFAIPNITMDNLGQRHTLVVGDSSINNSILGYLYSALTNSTTAEKNFACALLKYRETCQLFGGESNE